MSNKLILKIRPQNGVINIIGKNNGEVSVKPINLKFIMANSWWEKEPELETFFNVLELTIKRAIAEVYPHDKLCIDYTYSANDRLRDASEIIVEINSVKADDAEIKFEGDNIVLMGKQEKEEGFFKNLRKDKRENIVEKVHKEF